MARDLTSAVNKILMDYADEVELAMLKVEDDVSKEAAKKLKAPNGSPFNERSHGKHGRHYQKDWYVDNQSKKRNAKFIVANHQYQLTHLLEKGHDIIRNGVKVGHADAKEHIKPVEKWTQKEVVDRMEDKLRMMSKTTTKIDIVFKE